MPPATYIHALHTYNVRTFGQLLNAGQWMRATSTRNITQQAFHMPRGAEHIKRLLKEKNCDVAKLVDCNLTQPHARTEKDVHKDMRYIL